MKNCIYFGICEDVCIRIYMYLGYVYIVWFVVLCI